MMTEGVLFSWKNLRKFCFIGEKIPALGFLSTAMDWGFDTIHLNLKVINLALALQFHISVGQIIMIVVCIFTAPKIVGKLTS